MVDTTNTTYSFEYGWNMDKSHMINICIFQKEFVENNPSKTEQSELHSTWPVCLLLPVHYRAKVHLSYAMGLLPLMASCLVDHNHSHKLSAFLLEISGITEPWISMLVRMCRRRWMDEEGEVQ